MAARPSFAELARRAAEALAQEHSDQALSTRLLIAEERNTSTVAEMIQQGRLKPDLAVRFSAEFTAHLRIALLASALNGEAEGRG